MAIDAIEMSVDRWIAVPDNPRQRNTEKRAEYALTHHLKKYYPIHRFVYAATIGGEVVCKLDGHTRALLWKRDELETPPTGKVVVLLIDVKSMAEAKSMYDMLDAQMATKRPADIIFGAARENGFKMNSGLLKSCKIMFQLKMIEPTDLADDIYALVKKWKPYLIMLDEIGLSSQYTILIGFMLMAVYRDGVEIAGKFLMDLDKNRGIKDSKGMDGIEALRSHIEIRRAEGSLGGYDNLHDLAGKAWSAYTQWIDGKRLKRLNYNSEFFDMVAKEAGKRRLTPREV